MSARLQGKLAIVTGGSRGIGEAIAMEFAMQGARVIISSRKQDGLDATAERINEKAPDSTWPKACHMGKSEQIDALLEWVEKEHGQPDILVNNAATNPYFGPMLGLERGLWDKTFDVNLWGPFEFIRKVAERWMESDKPGVVVNLTSVAGMGAAPLQGLYGMTKAAIISMTQTLAVELAPSKIRVNAIAPGLVDTRFSAALTGSPEIVKIFTDHTALKRVAQPEEMAGAAVFLASDESRYVTGQTICVDGGYSIA